MPIECVWFDEVPDGPWEVGWCVPWGYELSKHYIEHVAAARKPISVQVPTRGGGSTSFCIDSHPTDEPDGAWTVAIVGPLVNGQRPDITVTPSIHCINLYHGWLTNGVLSDDLG